MEHVEGDYVKVSMVEYSDPLLNRGIQKKFREKRPYVKNLEEELDVIKQTLKIMSKMTKQENKLKIIKVALNDTEEDLWEKLINIKEEIQGDHRVASKCCATMATIELEVEIARTSLTPCGKLGRNKLGAECPVNIKPVPQNLPR